jgi:ABC-type transporter Mla MlaB component
MSDVGRCRDIGRYRGVGVANFPTPYISTCEINAAELAADMRFPSRGEDAQMLKVGYADTNGEQQWTLCGRLSGPWVDELRSFWQQIRERAPRARTVVDLTQVTFVDEAGEALLCEMQSSGARFVAAGVANKHMLECLKNKEERALRRRVEDLKAPCAESSSQRPAHN